jgi:hypothetical protein
LYGILTDAPAGISTRLGTRVVSIASSRLRSLEAIIEPFKAVVGEELRGCRRVTLVNYVDRMAATMATGHTSLINAEATSLIGESVDVVRRVRGTREAGSTRNLLTLNPSMSCTSHAEVGSRDRTTHDLYLR